MTTTNKLPILVGHQDTLLHLYLPERGEGRDFFTRSDKGHIDLPRAREAGLAGGFFSVFVPGDPSGPQPVRLGRSDMIRTAAGYEFPLPPALDLAYAQRVTMALTASLFRLEAESKGQVKVVRAVDELVACLRDDVHAA